MNTILIKSEKPDDIYFIRELVNRLGLESIIKEDGHYVGTDKAINPNKAEDKKLFEMSKSVRDNALADFLRNETEPIF